MVRCRPRPFFCSGDRADKAKRQVNASDRSRGRFVLRRYVRRLRNLRVRMVERANADEPFLGQSQLQGGGECKPFDPFLYPRIRQKSAAWRRSPKIPPM